MYVVRIVLLYFPVILCSTTVNYKDAEEEMLPTEKTALAYKVDIISERSTEFDSLTILMKSINGQLEKFNALYLGRLDEKLTSLAANVASLDSNVRNIQERAHVWDTFQLHVAAWNEQIKSVDRKVDIISSGQEKMLNLDAKLSTLPSIEFTSQKILNEVSGLQVRLETLGKSVTSISSGDRSLYGEFATRGMLAALKSVEGKVDSGRMEIKKLAASKRHGCDRVHRNNFGNDTIISQNKKLIVRCSTPPVIEELVKDMSSKVDLMYDKIAADNSSEEDEQPQDDISEEIDQDYSVEMYQSDDSRSHEKDLKLSKSEAKAVKKLRRHFKRSSNDKFEKILEQSFVKTFEVLNNFTKRQDNKVEHIIIELQNSSKVIFEKIERVTKIINDVKTNQIILTCCDNHVKHIRNDLKEFFKTCFKEKKYVEYSNDFDESNFNTTYSSDSTSDSAIVHDKTEEDILIITKSTNEETIITPKVSEESIQTNTFSYEQENYSSTTDKDIDKFDDRFINEKCLSKWNLYENKDAVFKDIEDLTCYILFSGFGPTYELNLCDRSGSERYCSPDGFVTIQSRKDGSVNFTRNWSDYTFGFGDLASENFWLGNEVIHVLTMIYNMTTLKVDLEDFESNQAWARFDTFEVSSRETAYALKVADYSGNASDSLSYHSGSRFSTYDQTNDRAPSCCPCSQYGGGWWFDSCFESNLNGVYYDKSTNAMYRGIIWEHWREENSLATTKMAIKHFPKQYTSVNKIEDP